MDWFTILILVVAGATGVHQFRLGLQALKTGETDYAFRFHYRRDEQPRMFWLVTGRRLSSPLAILVFALAVYIVFWK